MWEFASSQKRGHRDQQEDSVAIFQDRRRNCRRFLLVLADGAGGHGGGAEASAATLKVARTLWDRSSGSSIDARKFLVDLADLAHEKIRSLSASDCGDSAPRSTLVAAYCEADRAIWMHIGDSRLYLIRDGKVVRRTRDHSVVQLLVDRGSINYNDLRGHPDRSRLTQALGGESRAVPDFDEISLLEGDGLLLCSDGFWEGISSKEAGSILTSVHKLDEKLAQATMTAVERVSNCDNVSVVAARWKPGLERRTIAAIFGGTALALLAVGLVVLGRQSLGTDASNAGVSLATSTENLNPNPLSPMAPAAPLDVVPNDLESPPAAPAPSPDPGQRQPQPLPALPQPSPLPIIPAPTGPADPNFYRSVAEPRQYAKFENGIGMPLVGIEAGKFLDHSGKGSPLKVKIETAFWIGATEVTRAQYHEVMANDGSVTTNDDLPVTDVSFEDAVRFCLTLTLRERERAGLPEHLTYTLPSEDEWQYVCRCGDNERPAPALHEVKRLGWLADAGAPWSRQLQPVGTLDPNLWGLYDLFGNAGEWCSDKDGSSRKIMGGNVATPAFEVGYHDTSPAIRESGGPLTGFRVILKPGVLSK